MTSDVLKALRQLVSAVQQLNGAGVHLDKDPDVAKFMELVERDAQLLSKTPDNVVVQAHEKASQKVSEELADLLGEELYGDTSPTDLEIALLAIPLGRAHAVVERIQAIKP